MKITDLLAVPPVPDIHAIFEVYKQLPDIDNEAARVTENWCLGEEEGCKPILDQGLGIQETHLKISCLPERILQNVDSPLSGPMRYVCAMSLGDRNRIVIGYGREDVYESQQSRVVYAPAKMRIALECIQWQHTESTVYNYWAIVYAQFKRGLWHIPDIGVSLKITSSLTGDAGLKTVRLPAGDTLADWQAETMSPDLVLKFDAILPAMDFQFSDIAETMRALQAAAQRLHGEGPARFEATRALRCAVTQKVMGK